MSDRKQLNKKSVATYIQTAIIRYYNQLRLFHPLSKVNVWHDKKIKWPLIGNEIN